jgi:REP element-mobilizing transposase RayT
MPQSFAALYCHAVFGTKNRRPLIRQDIKDDLFGYMGGIARDLKCVLLKAGGSEDHVHLLVSLSREISVSRILREIKGGASRWVHTTFPNRSDFQWQAGYAAFTVSQSDLEGIKEYIDNQEEHHRNVSFAEELVSILEKHKIEYDPEYLFRD